MVVIIYVSFRNVLKVWRIYSMQEMQIDADLSQDACFEQSTWNEYSEYSLYEFLVFGLSQQMVWSH